MPRRLPTSSNPPGGCVVRSQPNVQATLAASRRATTPSLQTRARTPQPILSDITLRYCDKRLMDMQSEVIERLERHYERSSTPQPFSKAARRIVATTDEGSSTPTPTAIVEGSRKPTEEEACQPAPVVDGVAPGDGDSKGEVEGQLHEIPTVTGGAKRVKKRNAEASQVKFPSEVIAEYLPGVTSRLLDEAARRQKRALRRQKDFINLQKHQRKPIANEHELFPELITDTTREDEADDDISGQSKSGHNKSPPASMDVQEESTRSPAHPLHATLGNEGGVESPRMHSTTASFPILFTTPQKFDFSPHRHYQLMAQETTSPPASPCQNEDEREGAIKVNRLPETAEYQHLIRMQRAQQSQWKQQPRVWDAAMVREPQPHHSASKPSRSALGSNQLLLSQSNVLSIDQLSNSDNQGTPFSALAATGVMVPKLNFGLANQSDAHSVPLVPKLMIPLLANLRGGAPGPSDHPRGATSIVPKLNIPAIGHQRAPGNPEFTSPTNEMFTPSEAEGLSRPQDFHLSSRSETALTVASSSSDAAAPLLERRGNSPGRVSSDAMSPVAQSIAPSTQYTRSAARGHAHSSDDDDDEDVDALRQQFADFLKQTGNHGPRGHDDDDDANEVANVRPYVLPSTFVRYSLSSIRAASDSNTLMRRNPNLNRMDSLIDDSDRSTSYFSKTVKIIWGSCTPDAEPSSIARTAPCRLVVELSFRPGRHHFDAKHLYQLMRPFTEYVLDLEAGNRGGKFVAVYGYSELQCLKAIAAMMARVRNGESYLLNDCYCAPSPNQPQDMLLESPRDVDIDDERLPLIAPTSTRKRRRRTDVVSFVGSPDVEDPTHNDDAAGDDAEHDDDEEGKAPDPMAWFKRHATVIDTAVVNHHAPGAVQQFIAAVEKQKRQKVQKMKRLSKRKSSSVALATALATAAGESSSFIPAAPEESEVEVEKDLTLFIAEGDEVEGLEGIDLTVPAVDDEPEEDSMFEVDNDPEGLGRTMSKVKKPPSIFSIKEMDDDDVQVALENNTWSIMELVARSKYSPEELRRMRSQAVAAKRATLTKSQLHKLEKSQQRAMTSLKDFRDGKAREADVETSSTTSRKSQMARKPRKRNARALHAKRKKKMDDDERANSPTKEPVPAAADANADQQPAIDNPTAPAAGDDTVALSISAIMCNSVVISPSGDGDTFVSPTAEDPSPEVLSREKRQELDDAEALALFAEFLQQYATSEKVAIIAPICNYDDPSLLPVPNAEADAEDLIFLLHQVDYDIVVMAPPTAVVAPGPDATPEELDEYNEQVEFDRKRWFLTPTAQNIAEVTESLLRQNQGGKYCCVSLFIISRGFTGTLARRVSYPYERSDQPIVLTMDSDTNDLTTENTINPRSLAHQMKKVTGKVPMIFVDTYPLPDIPNSDSYALYLNAVTAPPPQATNFGRFSSQPQAAAAPQRVPAPAFLSFTAQPEDGGSELLCHYPKNAGGLGTYYLKRALEGRACPPKSLVCTMSNMIWFLSAKLQKRNCKIQHNAVVPKAYSSLRPYFDLSVVYDSAYEMQRNLAAAHVVEVTTGARIRIRCRVQLDQTMYVTESDSFLFAQEYWARQLRRDLHKILYPKNHDLPPAQGAKGGGGGAKGGAKQAQLIIKPRPEKAMRLRCTLCRCVPDNLVVQYPDCADLLFDEKRFRAVERDVARISEKCDVIQQEEPHGFSFAHGLHLLSAQTNAVKNPMPVSNNATQRPVELVRGAKAQRNNTLEFDANRFSRQDTNLKLMKEYVQSRAAHTSISLALRPLLPSGCIVLQFFGLRKRLQQDFAMNYLISGCQRVTTPGTTLVSLFKRPSMLWGEVDVDFVGNRRDIRKLDRLMRQQALHARGGDSIIITRVDLDLYETTEHMAAQSIQRIFRGHLVRSVLRAQQRGAAEEALARDGILEEERHTWYLTMLQFYAMYKRMLEAFEDRNRFDMFFEEQENRWYLIVEARKLLQSAYERGRQRLMTEEILESLPLQVEVAALHLSAVEAFDYAWIMAFHWHIHGSAWDRYYLEMDCYQEILRVRNVFRDETALERYQLGYLMDHPEPPSTVLDSGRSIIRGIQEEKTRRERKILREKLQLAAEQAKQRQKQEAEEEAAQAEAAQAANHALPLQLEGSTIAAAEPSTSAVSELEHLPLQPRDELSATPTSEAHVVGVVTPSND